MRIFGGGELGRARRASLAFFGKHPAFADFMPRIGAESEALVRTKQALLQGLEEQKSQWEELKERELHSERLIEGFDHWFLWLRPGRVLFGLLWSSRDAISRDDAAGLCVDAEGVSPRFVLASLRPVLEKWSQALRDARDAAQVEEYCQKAREELTRLVVAAPEETSAADTEARRVFLERPEMGPDRQGWRRVLHALQPVLSGSGRPDAVGQVRVPMGTTSRAESLRLWTEFLAGAVNPGTPVLAICREGAGWVDLIAGEPSPVAFRCLQASNRLVPLTTATPYELDPEVERRWPACESRWLSGNGPARSRKGWLLAAIVISGVVVVLLLLASGRSGKSKSGVPPAASSPQSPVAAEAPGGGSNVPATAVAAPKPEPPAPANPQTSAPPPVASTEPKTVAPTEANPELTRLVASARQAEQAGNFTNSLELYWAAKKLSPDDPELLDKIKQLTPKAQEQNQAAGQQARQQQLVESEIRRMVDSAAALAATGDLSNALRTYEAALKLKDDPQVRMAIATLSQKMQEAASRAAREAEDAKRFQSMLEAGRKSEERKDYTGALASYQAALALRKDDPVVIKRVQDVTARIEEQKKADAARADQARRETEQFEALKTTATQAEQAGNFTNALASLRQAQTLRPADEQVAARIKDLTPRAEQQAREAGEVNRDSKLGGLDAELEKLQVSFGLLKPDQAKTEAARKARLISGLLSMEDLNNYLNAVGRLEADYKAGGWLNQDQRTETLKRLKATILSRN